MDLIIDKANLKSFLTDNRKNDVGECIRLIKQGINVIFNFDKDEIQNSSDREIISSLLLMFAEGVGDTNRPKWEKQVDSANIKSNFANTLQPSQKRNVYLLDSDAVNKVKEKGAILIGGVGDEVTILSSIILKDTEKQAVEIASWEDYCPKLPITDIIICDNHFYNNKTVFEANEYSLIKAMCVLPKQSPVNCVVIVKKGEVDNNIDLSQEAERLKQLLKKLTDSTKSMVTIVLTYKTHDRNVITNYYRLKCGTCFHLKKNGVKGDVTAEIKTHANRNNENISLKLLKEYQDVVSQGNASTIYGDRVSNFLKFEN